jgi:F-box/TPR repeat protein Pof3
MVLEYISFRHMVNCMRVSRGWRDYLSKIAKLWMHLDMSGARKPIPRSFVNMAYKRSQYRMIRVTVHRFEHMDVLKNLALAAKHLTELTLISLPHTMSSTLVDIAKSAPGLTKLIVHPNITADTVTQIMRARPALEHVAFHSVKYTSHSCEWVGGPFDKLNSVLLHCEHMTSTFILNLASLLGQTPSLQTLSLANMIHAADPLLILPTAESQLPRLTTLELQRIAMSQFPNLPPTLRHLTLELSPITDVSSGRLTLLRNHLPELTDLNFSGFELPAESLEQLLDLHLDESQTVRETTGAKPLVSLRICCPLHIEDENEGFFKGPGSVCGRSRRILTSALERLDMAGTCCDDDEIEQLLTYETSLTCIDLSRTKISGAAIKMLADKLPGLKSIKADECTKITGRDAIQYAERKGIRVSCQMNEKTGGRKVRYG